MTDHPVGDAAQHLTAHAGAAVDPTCSPWYISTGGNLTQWLQKLHDMGQHNIGAVECIRMIETWERHQSDIGHVLDTRLYLGKAAIRLATVQQTWHRHRWQDVLQRGPVPLGRRQRLKVVVEELCLFLLRQRREADPQPSQEGFNKHFGSEPSGRLEAGKRRW